MEYFHYKVKDQKGQELEGTISSVDQQKATEALQARGFKVLNIVSRSQATTGHPIVNQPAAKVPMPAMPTYGLYQYKGTDKQRYFILGQMSELLRAGVNPAQGFVTLGQNQGNVGFRKSLEEMAATSTAGGSISEVMRKYPRLYPEHVIGLTKAGEAGGFLSEALDVAAKQAGDSHSFKLFHWFVWVVIINLFLAVPLSILGGIAFRDTAIKSIDGGGSIDSGGVAALFGRIFAKQLVWPTGPISILFYLIFFGVLFWLFQDQNKLLRHKLGLRYRIFRKRATFECASIFAWAISQTARAGISPSNTWSLAADCVPNLEFRRRLLTAGQMLNEGSRISEAIGKVDLLPEEYLSLTTTGELTGTVPGTFERLAFAARSEYDGQTRKAKFQTGLLGCLWLIIGSGIATALFFYFYSDLLMKMMNDI